MATSGTLSLRASATAIVSCAGSTTKMACGSEPMPLTPPMYFSNRVRSFSSCEISFFEMFW